MMPPAASSGVPARRSAVLSLMASIIGRVRPTRRGTPSIITAVSSAISWVRRVSM